jgi:hypothetical protein
LNGILTISFAETFEAIVVSPDGKNVVTNVTMNDDGSCGVSYTPLVDGPHTVTLKRRGSKIKLLFKFVFCSLDVPAFPPHALSSTLISCRVGTMKEGCVPVIDAQVHLHLPHEGLDHATVGV